MEALAGAESRKKTRPVPGFILSDGTFYILISFFWVTHCFLLAETRQSVWEVLVQARANYGSGAI